MTTHTFSREEIEAAAQAALDNWDFSEELLDNPEQVKRNLSDIVDGSDNVGADEDYPAEIDTRSDRETALIDWLHNYVTVSR